jgi:hypothetical protein
MSDATDIPKPGRGDALHAFARAGLGSAPIVGAAAAELFNWFIKAPLERRRDEWMAEVGERLKELEEKHGLNLADLQTDEAFVDTVLQASQVALRSAQREKREALRNAILNSALHHGPDESEQQMFLHLIDRFTPWHLRMLDFFNDPPAWFDHHKKARPEYHIGSCLDTVLQVAYPKLKPREPFYTQVCGELDNSGLFSRGMNLKTMMTADGWTASRTTERGKAFLRFIREPKPPAQ